MSDVTQICTLTLNNLLLGIRVGDVQEVLPAQTLTPVPLMPPAVAGLLNLRGQIVSAVDMRCVLHLPPRSEDSPPPMHVIVRHGQETLSLMVDDVGEILQISSQRLLPPPDSTPRERRSLFCGAFPLPERLLLLLDTCQALETIVAQATAKSPDT
jgi:purine-binding chemotaxis protein CheW